MRCNQLHISIMKVAGSYMLVGQTKHDNYMTCSTIFTYKKVQSENYLTVSLVQWYIFCLYLDTVNKIQYSNCFIEFRTPPKYSRTTSSPPTHRESKEMCNITKYLSRNKTSQYVNKLRFIALCYWNITCVMTSNISIPDLLVVNTIGTCLVIRFIQKSWRIFFCIFRFISRLNFIVCGYGNRNGTQESTSKVHLESAWYVNFIIIMTSMVSWKLSQDMRP